MAPNIFMSYSRRETGFVDDLTHRLEKAGFNIWLDYRRLIPGTPWAGQIQKGLQEAEVVLLVVSKDSIASQYVELEWRHVLNEKNKRIILVLFEAVKLPDELKKYEWVDFRGSYEAGIKELILQLKQPIRETQAPPESGFKAPVIVWASILLSAIAGIYSLLSFWTILLPLILVPLAWQVYKRNYNFSRVQTALWMSPLLNLFGVMLFYEISHQSLEGENIAVYYFRINPLLGLLVSILQWLPFSAFILIFLFRSEGMQRWGKPEANMPKFVNPYTPKNPNPTPVRFYIDHAEQDFVMAKDISNKLIQYGHQQEADIKSAESVLVLISRFKTDTTADPEHQIVFPVLVQTAQPSEKLSHVQWIDYRKGLKNLDALAQLLPDPTQLLTALGTRPTNGAQIVMPNMLSRIVNFLTFILLLNISTFFIYLLELWSNGLGYILQDELAFIFSNLAQTALAVLLTGGLGFFIVKSVTERRGVFSSIRSFFAGAAGLFLMLSYQYTLADYMTTLFEDYGETEITGFIAIPFLFFIFGGIVLLIMIFFNWKELRRWFPKTSK
ncbi:MAG: toll/interleukin-1 receptor domain-containing protein [Anaerolineales bacterium]